MNKLLRSVLFERRCTYSMVLYFILLFQNNIFAQVKFSAVSSDKRIGKNEYLQVQYIIENAASVTRITPPVFKDFSVVSGPNQQSGISNNNGNIKQYISIGFVLKPLSAGNFTIAPATAKAEGKEFNSNVIKVEVTNSSTSNRSGGTALTSPFANIIPGGPLDPEVHEYDDYILHKGENLQDKIRKNIFIKADVNKQSCYAGEPVVAVYKLFTRLKSESNLTKSPSFNGFSVSELEKPDNYSLHTEKLNGREYNVYILRKVQLYPLQPGTIELEPAEVENRITFIKADYADARKGDIFYDMMRDFADASTPQEAIQQQIVTLQSKPVTIEVKPLPDENKPDQFKGAVGDFKIYAFADKNNITTDDVNNLKIIISGTGNIQLINHPEITWPKGLEGFEPRTSEKINTVSVPMKGEKIFTYAFTALKPSVYNIPSIAFSYFDINARAYRTITSKPVAIAVTKGSGNRRRINAFNAQNNKLPETLSNKLYENRWLLIAGFCLGAVLVFWFINYARQKKLAPIILKNKSKEDIDHEENIITDKFIIPEDPLRPAKENLEQNDSKLFYRSLNSSLKKYLSAKLKFPEEDLTKKKINELLDKYNVGIGTSLMLTLLLENIEMNLYAPISSADEMQTVYEKAGEIVALLDKQVN